MPENYIDKIKKDGVEYNIHASNGGTQLYKHSIAFGEMKDIIAISTSAEPLTPGSSVSTINTFLNNCISVRDYSNLYFYDFVSLDDGGFPCEIIFFGPRWNVERLQYEVAIDSQTISSGDASEIIDIVTAL